MSRAKRIIKKYANRRLYDTETSQAINLEDVRDMIGGGDSVQVVEAKTGTDVTRQVLLQIVADQEMLGRPVLSDEFLEAMIRVNSNPMRDMAREYLERVMMHLQSQQQPLEKAFAETLGKTGLDGLGAASMEPYRKLQERMFALWTDALKPPLARNEPEEDT
ncbi:MAG: polyhydroxyalkanoate synthesis repressor PhaR [Wenzhouxiangellaceae bacterium]|nr:polyhydroxyalkanoate synthesis repressor PhaR [Wenzhouxiangellaceae bacterium]MBS3746018.1 polyhydroxyalkanoate synthesis repressor PhaR [Wenzhouxiangellaceae bacterium]MBS3822380.1 polyhydroxyalkanoate synthesis repressor PhaR [Wenzhouxiangellaceae bacterium]